MLPTAKGARIFTPKSLKVSGGIPNQLVFYVSTCPTPMGSTFARALLVERMQVFCELLAALQEPVNTAAHRRWRTGDLAQRLQDGLGRRGQQT
jgi:hypothetical protein